MDKIIFYVCELIIAIAALSGNGLVLIAFHKERRLRRRINYYIASLAAINFLTGFLNIPCTLLIYIVISKQHNYCLLILSFLIILQIIFVFNLIAFFIDRYWTVLYPVGYSKHIRPKRTKGNIKASKHFLHIYVC